MQLLKHWSVYFVGRILPATITFASIALYTRLLDPGSFGIYALLLSTSFAVGLIGYSWLRVAALRMIATVSDEDKPNLLSTIGLAFFGLSIAVALAVVLIVRLYDPALNWTLVLLAAACAVASGWFELNVAILQARLHSVGYGLLQLGRVLGTLLSSVALIFAGFKASALLGGFAIGNLASLAALGLWSDVGRGRFDPGLLRRFFTFGWPSSAGSIGIFANTFQRYALEAVGGSALVGIYAAATDFAQQTIGLLMGTATLAGQPLAFRARDHGAEGQLSKQLRMNARAIFAIGLPAAVGLAVLSGPISHFYLGPRFHVNAGTIMAIAAGTMFLSGLRGGYFEQAFEIAFDTRAVAINAVIRVALVVGLSLWLIPLQGAVGAAIAMLLSEVFGLLLSIVWARRLMSIPIPSLSWLKIATATSAMVAAIVLTPWRSTFWGLAVAVCVGVLVYSGAIAWMHVHGIRAYLGSLAPVAER